ncbi:hypothetical protein EG028_05090 [Chitinophaga barathri]|uniref:Uncharacterized protein n=1 Tax=Chitinophaga barathri TaxID=1647451 RepID=A0A3N4MFE3_9BACT|nr:hypothetical protein EG028_05090 [Chitinophaga barathri]
MFFSYNKLKAQVKIGGDPAFVNPDAILELESNRKGFLLPRLNATGYTFLKTRNVTPGMVIYLTDASSHPNGKGFYFKTGTGNTDADWTKMQEDDGSGGSPWKMGGNANATTGSFFGTPTGVPTVPLDFKLNGSSVMTFATTGRLTIPYANVDVAGAGVNDVLMIGSDGVVQKQNLSLTSVTSLNAVKGDALLQGAASPSNTVNTASAAGSGQNVTLTFPTMLGGASQTYGFMTKADWDKLNNITSATGFTVKDLTPADAVAGAKSAKLEKDVAAGADGKWILSLFPATETNPGVVTVGNQTFAGTKTFDGDIAITNVNGGNGGLITEGNITTKAKLNIDITSDVSAAATTVDVLVKEGSSEVKKLSIDPTRLGSGVKTITANGAATGASAAPDGKLNFALDSAGTNFNIATTATGVTFNIPSASGGSRGLVNTAPQTFGGEKTFRDSLTVGVGNSTSNFNLNGSMSVKVRTLPGGSGAVLATDYIVQVAGTLAAELSVTVPTASADNLGRIYIIRRIPAVGTDNSIIKISDDGGKQISGRATIDIDEPYFSVTLISMGTTWEVLSRSASNY